MVTMPVAGIEQALDQQERDALAAQRQRIRELERELRGAGLTIAAIVRQAGGEVRVPLRALVEVEGELVTWLDRDTDEQVLRATI
jgi:transcription elongation GreA/GreB family factor